MEQILDFDRPFWKTVCALLTRPAETARAYIEGRRRSLASPIRLFLIFAMLSTVVHLLLDPPQEMQVSTAPVVVRAYPGERLSSAIGYWIYEQLRQHAALLNVILIPVVALVYVPLFRRQSGYNFAEQLTGVFYAYAIIFFVDAVTAPWLVMWDSSLGTNAVFVAINAYAIGVAVRLNRDRWIPGVFKGVLAHILLYAMAAALASVAILVLPDLIAALVERVI